MSAHDHGHEGHHGHHIITHDTAKAANMATFLGLVSFTFFAATAVGCNVYLRAWSHDQFTLTRTALKDLPYYDTLGLIVAGILLLFAGHFFRVENWRKFNVTMALAVPFYLIIACVQYMICTDLANQSAQIITAYEGPAIIQFVMTLFSFILLVRVNWISREKLRVHFPVSMNVWLYTIAMSIIILVLTQVVDFGSMAAWCGTKLTNLANLGK